MSEKPRNPSVEVREQAQALLRRVRNCAEATEVRRRNYSSSGVFTSRGTEDPSLAKSRTFQVSKISAPALSVTCEDLNFQLWLTSSRSAIRSGKPARRPRSPEMP